MSPQRPPKSLKSLKRRKVVFSFPRSKIFKLSVQTTLPIGPLPIFLSNPTISLHYQISGFGPSLPEFFATFCTAYLTAFHDITLCPKFRFFRPSLPSLAHLLPFMPRI